MTTRFDLIAHHRVKAAQSRHSADQYRDQVERYRTLADACEADAREHARMAEKFMREAGLTDEQAEALMAYVGDLATVTVST